MRRRCDLGWDGEVENNKKVPRTRPGHFWKDRIASLELLVADPHPVEGTIDEDEGHDKEDNTYNCFGAL